MEINIIGKMNAFATFIWMGWRFDSFLLNYKINFDGTKRASWYTIVNKMMQNKIDQLITSIVAKYVYVSQVMIYGLCFYGSTIYNFAIKYHSP